MCVGRSLTKEAQAGPPSGVTTLLGPDENDSRCTSGSPIVHSWLLPGMEKVFLDLLDGHIADVIEMAGITFCESQGSGFRRQLGGNRGLVLCHGREMQPASPHSDILLQGNFWSPFPCGHLVLLLRSPFTCNTFISVLCAPPAASVLSWAAGLGLATAQLLSEA